MNKEEYYWNMNRVIKEYAKVASIFNDDISFDKVSYPKQIILRRIASVLCAFMNIKDTNTDVIGTIDLVFGHVENKQLLETSHINTENEKKIFTLIDTFLKPTHMKEELNNVILDVQTRKTLFDKLLRYRVESEYLKTTFSSIIEGNFTVNLAINICASIYNDPLKECNNKLELLLELLLGDLFSGKFSIKELRENYNYPLVTDEELLAWTLDNI